MRPLDRYKLQVLLELDASEYHVFQIERYKTSSIRHPLMAAALNFLIEDGYVEFVGDEYLLTTQGKDAIEIAIESRGGTR
jgi:DNA-binding HxlR family transcriptional regulator